MRVKTLDGKIFTGSDAGQVARAMWKSMLVPDETFELWLENSAKRAKNWNGAIVRTTRAAEHLEDLLAAGIIFEV